MCVDVICPALLKVFKRNPALGSSKITAYSAKRWRWCVSRSQHTSSRFLTFQLSSMLDILCLWYLFERFPIMNYLDTRTINSDSLLHVCSCHMKTSWETILFIWSSCVSIAPLVWEERHTCCHLSLQLSSLSWSLCSFEWSVTLIAALMALITQLQCTVHQLRIFKPPTESQSREGAVACRDITPGCSGLILKRSCGVGSTHDQQRVSISFWIRTFFARRINPSWQTRD